MSKPVRFGADKEGADYIPAGEGQGLHTHFSAEQVANAFGVAVERVHRAFAGEFNLEPEAKVVS